MRFLYTFSIFLYTAGIKFASLFNRKAALWCKGRRAQFRRLKEQIHSLPSNPSGECIWIHCASLGEFEQGRPVIEQIRKEKPEIRIVLTFFSPSGYEVRKNYSGVDLVTYLPADLPGNTQKFLDLIQPTLALFVKYEFWFNYLYALKKRNIPHFLVSGIFRPDQLFFKWYGGWFRRALFNYKHMFLQDENSAELLREAGLTAISVTGDTRFDRVIQVVKEKKEDAMCAGFSEGASVMVCGSTWEEDEELILNWFRQSAGQKTAFKLIIAPHNISRSRLAAIEDRFSSLHPQRHSVYKHDPGCCLLIIDHIGMLSSLYHYGKYCYIGGGFGKGIHNILEAAVHGKPVLF